MTPNLVLKCYRSIPEATIIRYDNPTTNETDYLPIQIILTWIYVAIFFKSDEYSCMLIVDISCNWKCIGEVTGVCTSQGHYSVHSLTSQVHHSVYNLTFYWSSTLWGYV